MPTTRTAFSRIRGLVVGRSSSLVSERRLALCLSAKRTVPPASGIAWHGEPPRVGALQVHSAWGGPPKGVHPDE